MPNSPSFTASDPEFAARIRASFARQGAMSLIGAQIQQVQAGRVLIALPHQAAISQQHGFVHAGIVATALDSACGYAAATLMPADAGVLTIEFKINLLAPARGPWIWLEGQVTKAGRSISVADGRAYEAGAPSASSAPGAAALPEQHKLIATLTATLMTVTGRDDVRH
ncbi:MAG: hypothetical protein RIQ60_1556 [Pseudomonadota bacterium]|jgi:uncharacterized protein (TIGR00369 family)